MIDNISNNDNDADDVCDTDLMTAVVMMMMVVMLI